MTIPVAGNASHRCLCGKRAVLALVALVALAFPVYYVAVSPAAFFRSRQPTLLTLDYEFMSSAANVDARYVASEALEASNDIALQRLLQQASVKLSSGANHDLVVYETIGALLGYPNGSSFLAQAYLQRALSDSLRMTFPDALRVHAIVQSYMEGYHTKDYRRVATPSDCADGTLGVIIVPSLPVSAKRRELIRKVWSSRLPEWHLRLVFVVGLTPDVAGKDLEGEYQLHKDMLVLEFVESYYNLSLKSLLAMRWVSEHCSAASYMVKADDDVYIYPENLHSLLLSRKPHERKIIGNVGKGFSPHRSMTSKWYVPLEIYKDPGYPTFVFGPCYMIAVDALKDLVDSCKRLRYVYLEDVFITGICSHAVSGYIEHEQVLDFLVNSCENSNAVAVHHSKVPYRTC